MEGRREPAGAGPGGGGRGGAESRGVPRDSAPNVQAQPGGKRAVIPSRALPLQAPQPAPSVVLTPTCLGMGPRSGREQMLKRNPQPGRSECAASGTRAEWRSQETRAPVAEKESRPGRRNNGEVPQPPGRGKRRLAARCPGKSEENQLTEGRKIFRRERRTWRAGAPAGRGFTRTIPERAEPAVVGARLGSAQKPQSRTPQRSECSPFPFSLPSPVAYRRLASLPHSAPKTHCAPESEYPGPGSEMPPLSTTPNCVAGSPRLQPLIPFAPSCFAGALTPGGESRAATRTRTGG